MTYKSIFRFHNICINLINYFTSHITVSITCTSIKTRLTYSVFCKCLKHLCTIIFCTFINFPENVCTLFLSFFCKLYNSFIYIKKAVDFMIHYLIFLSAYFPFQRQYVPEQFLFQPHEILSHDNSLLLYPKQEDTLFC